MKEIDLIFRNSIRNLNIMLYLNYIHYFSWFDKWKNVTITNHETIFFLQCRM